MDPWITIGTLLIYGAGLVIAYRQGANRTKKKYADLINRLHKQYREEMNTESDLLSVLTDLEQS